MIKKENKQMKRKVGIMTFESNLCIYGDGTKNEIRVSRNELNDYDYLLKNGKTIANDMISKPIQKSIDHLKKKNDKLTHLGGTALGPGLLTAVAMAGEGAPGSIVILCTDGMANEGLGKISGY